MHLAEAFIQSNLHCIQVTVFYILSALAFPGNRTHDLGVASAMLYQLSSRKDISKLKHIVGVLYECTFELMNERIYIALYCV